MKTNVKSSVAGVFLAVVFLFSFGVTNAQERPEKVYIEVGCIKEKGPELESFILNEGMAFNKVSRDKGQILDFIVLKVLYPNGDDCRCDYRVVSVYSDLAQLDELVKPNAGFEIANEAFGDKAQEVYNKWKSIGIDRGSEIFELKMEAIDGPSYSPMSMVNFINVEPGHSADYEKMQKEVWMPVVKEAAKEGMLTDISIWERVLPEGNDFDGDYIQVIDIKNFAQMGSWEMSKFAAIFQKVHPGKDLAETIKKSDKLTKLGHDETMQVIGRLSDMK